MDETGLFYRLLPNQTLSTQKKESGTKKSKERVTIGLCANATGTDKLRPILIGKSKKPRPFKNFEPSLYVDYQYNKKAWMTSPIFCDWMDKLNTRMKNEGRNIALVIDNASSHGKETQWSNVTVFFLPPNTTSKTQPMDAGVIRNFKCKYKKSVTREAIKQIEANETPKVDLAQCVRFVSQAWKDVTPTTIQKCWNHTKILPAGHLDEVSSDVPDDAEAAEAELSTLLQSVPGAVSASEFIDCDSDLPVGDDPTDDDIIAMCTHEDDDTPSTSTPDDEEPESDEPAQPPVTARQALDGLHFVQRYMEQHNLDHMDAIHTLFSAIHDRQHRAAVQSSLLNYFRPETGIDRRNMADE